MSKRESVFRAGLLRGDDARKNVISAQAEINPSRFTETHNDHGLSACADNDKGCTQPRNKPAA